MNEQEIIDELKRATDGLLMMSESDYPFDIVHIDGKTSLTHQDLRNLVGKDINDPVSLTEVENFFRTSTSEAAWKNESQIATARRFQKIVRLFQEELKETRVYKIGNIDITVLILGKSPQGNWLGLSTRVIET